MERFTVWCLASNGLGTGSDDYMKQISVTTREACQEGGLELIRSLMMGVPTEEKAGLNAG